MNKKIIGVITLFIFTILSISFKNMNSDRQPSLQYLVRQPKIQSGKAPLIILLHGVGSNERDMFSFAQLLPDNFLVVSVRAPITLRQDGYAWFQVNFTANGPEINPQQAENSRKEILKFIEDLKNVEKFDEKQVYLMGFSQGGIMSYSVALTEPEKIKGIAVMSGRLLPEVKPLIADEQRLQKLNIFVSHGIQDPVLKLQYAIDAVDYLKSKKLNPHFQQYTADHTINQQMLNDVIIWLNNN